MGGPSRLSRNVWAGNSTPRPWIGELPVGLHFVALSDLSGSREPATSSLGPRIDALNPPPMKSSPSPRLPSEPVAPSYEAALQELEQLVSNLETGQLALDQLLGSYQRAAQLLGFCRDQLAAVEGQVKVLEGTDLKPWSVS